MEINKVSDQWLLARMKFIISWNQGQIIIFTARKRSLGQGNIITPVCHSVHRGGCVLLLPGGVRGCSWGGCGMCGCSGGMGGGGVCGCSGACVHGCSWGGGMHGCSQGGVVACGGCVVAGGACMVAPRGDMHGCSGGGGMCGIQQDTEIRSMSRRYASYWNAFLFIIDL